MLERAIYLSKEKHCSVPHSIDAEITASYSIDGLNSEKTL